MLYFCSAFNNSRNRPQSLCAQLPAPFCCLVCWLFCLFLALLVLVHMRAPIHISSRVSRCPLICSSTNAQRTLPNLLEPQRIGIFGSVQRCVDCSLSIGIDLATSLTMSAAGHDLLLEFCASPVLIVCLHIMLRVLHLPRPLLFDYDFHLLP